MYSAIRSVLAIKIQTFLQMEFRAFHYIYSTKRILFLHCYVIYTINN